MLPIFNKYIRYLNDKCGLVLEENKYWLNTIFIKGFTKDGESHNLYKLNIKKDLSIEYSVCQEIDSSELMTFDELVEYNIEHIKELELNSLKMLSSKMKKFKDYEPLIPISTGKDSMVTLFLARLLNPDIKAIFNNTSLDVADTYTMVKQIKNCEIMNPEQGFYDWIKTENMIPSRMNRACCSIFKSGVMLKYLDKEKPYLMILGMRNSESNTRSEYEDEWVNTEWGVTKWQGILPVRKWNDLDIWLYMLYRKLPINDKYKKGYQRVGCGVACPFYTKNTWALDDYWYPTLRMRWLKILAKDFLENNKATVLNCTFKEYLQEAWNGGVYRDKPTKRAVREFAAYKDLDFDIALKYFNKQCSNCGKKLKSNEVALSLKYHGRNTKIMFCKCCFGKEYKMSREQINGEINRFKEEGCSLF